MSLGLSLLFIFVTPFVQAGLVGMADEALDGRTRVGTFLEAGKRHYLSVLGAYLVVVGISFLLGIVAVLGAFIGGAVALGTESTGTVALALVGAVLLLVVLLYLVVVMFLQFYGQAIVLDGASAIDGLKRSAGLVRRNLASTVGYMVVLVVLSSILGGIGALVSYAAGPTPTAGTGGGAPAAAPTLSLTAAALLVVYVLVTALVGGVTVTYSVAFYRGIRDRTTGRL